MNRVDPKVTALRFNEYIKRQDIEGPSSLMTEAHTFVGRKGEAVKGSDRMTAGWKPSITLSYPGLILVRIRTP